MSADSLVEATISKIQSVADSLVQTARSYTDSIQNQLATGLSISSPEVTGFKDFNLPFSPVDDQAAVYAGKYEDAYNELADKIGTWITNYVTTYFPQFSSGLAAAEQWLANQIQNGGSGVNSAVEAAMFERARARILRDVARAREEAYGAFAARGFSIPSGALQGVLLTLEQEAIDKVSEVNRDILIKAWEAEIEILKFAVESALNYRVSAIRNALDYVLAHLKIPELAIERARTLADLRIKMYDSTAAYYNALVNKARVELDYSEANARLQNEANRIVAEFSAQAVRGRADAAAAGATAIGNAAAAALSALNTLAAITHNTEE